MITDGSAGRARRRAGAVAVVGAALVAAAAAGAGTAGAEELTSLPAECVEVSQDGGATWVPQTEITAEDPVIDWLPVDPAPGTIEKHAEFLLRNHCDTPARAQVYAGRWSVTGGGSAILRADLDGQTGTPVTIGAGGSDQHGLLLAQTGGLATDQAVDVALYIGVPADETAQDFTITPAWTLTLVEMPGGGALGSLGSLTGSLGSLGSAGAAADDDGAAGLDALRRSLIPDAAPDLAAPAVTVGAARR